MIIMSKIKICNKYKNDNCPLRVPNRMEQEDLIWKNHLLLLTMIYCTTQ